MIVAAPVLVMVTFAVNPLAPPQFDAEYVTLQVPVPPLALVVTASVPEFAEKFGIDPASGQVLLRFVNDNAENQLGFGFGVSIEGTVQ